MYLYLVQHGQAHSQEVDPERGLTDIGKENVEKVASFFRRLNIEVASVWESGKKRATQTAEILSSALTSRGGLVCEQGLAPLDPVASVAAKLSSLDSDYMIVGHLPFLARLASYLVIGKEEPEIIRFQQGGVVCLERGSGSGWVVRWIVVPDML